MRSRTSKQFWTRFAHLPPEIQRRAPLAFRAWIRNPDDPRLNFKVVQRTAPMYSVRVTKRYRALGMRSGEEIIWFWIGAHDEYLRILRNYRAHDG